VHPPPFEVQVPPVWTFRPRLSRAATAFAYAVVLMPWHRTSSLRSLGPRRDTSRCERCASVSSRSSHSSTHSARRRSSRRPPTRAIAGTTPSPRRSSAVSRRNGSRSGSTRPARWRRRTSRSAIGHHSHPGAASAPSSSRQPNNRADKVSTESWELQCADLFASGDPRRCALSGHREVVYLIGAKH